MGCDLSHRQDFGKDFFNRFRIPYCLLTASMLFYPQIRSSLERGAN